jgi:hypothetical protein
MPRPRRFESASVQAKLSRLGADPRAKSTAKLIRIVSAEHKVAKAAGLKAN